MTLCITLYNPKTQAPVGRFTWAQIIEMIGDNVELLENAIDLFHRGEGLLLSRLIWRAQKFRRPITASEGRGVPGHNR